ncbi:DUF4397 domain-containing protein [Vibrio maritimus]|uniref:DUF4397 domain-containing protein n=1 Tax=Vibrio maritimus TaxID=990268 RepID=UPI004068CB38
MNIIKTSVIAAAAITIVGCGSDSDSTPTTQVRVTHASSDAPLVNVKANGAILSGLSNVDYQQGSGLITVDSGTYDLAVDAIGADDSTAEVLSAPGTNLAPDMQYDIFAVNNTASLQAVVLSRSGIKPDSNSVRIDVLHAHPSVGAVDIHLTTDASISAGSVAVAGLAFAIDSADLPVTVPADTYRIRITPAGQSTDADVVFDSGDLALAGGSDLMVTAVPNVVTSGTGESPVDLLVADGSSVAVVRDADGKAVVRAGHAIQDAPAVDIVANGATVAGLTNLTYENVASVELAPGTVDVGVTVAGTTTPEVISVPGATFSAGSETTIFAVGRLDDSSQEALVIEDDLRGIATYAKIRVVHANPTAAAATVDIHAVADGGAFSASTVVLSGVTFKDTAVLKVPAGTYDLAVAEAGTTNILLQNTSVPAVANGNVVTAYATETSIALNIDK